MHQTSMILGLLAQTSIHAGTGSTTGLIDLPIQREGHNGWPCVFGSAVKGALRARAETSLQSGNLACVFGPDTNNASDHAGALMVSDARLLLLPVRSLTSQFKWVTCPDALSRYARDCQRFDVNVNALEPLSIDENAAVVPEQSHDSDLFLEEYRFTATKQALGSLIESLAALMQRDDAVNALEQQLVIVSNTMFAHLAQHATPVNAHIALDSATKTVRKGALWFEETLPPETLLYVGLSAVKARSKDSKLSSDDVLNEIKGLFGEKPWLQLGGNETVGMGWCAVKMRGAA